MLAQRRKRAHGWWLLHESLGLGAGLPQSMKQDISLLISKFGIRDGALSFTGSAGSLSKPKHGEEDAGITGSGTSAYLPRPEMVGAALGSLPGRPD